VVAHEILTGVIEDILPTLPANHYHGVFCDPPYGLSFMGKSWDHGVPSASVWAEVLRVCRPGANLLAFGGTRTFHRLVCAIEDAGWEIRDVLMWVYSQGFPKSLNLGEGYGTALKPAYEPVILARKPLDSTVAANVQKWGCGALWIDGGRIGMEPSQTYPKRRNAKIFTTGSGGQDVTPPTGGRWPANLLHDGSDEVAALFPDSKGQQGDVRGSEPSRTGGEGTSCYGEFGRVPAQKRGDSGSAARFFYCAKASQSERNAGCKDLPARTAGEVTGGRQEGSAGLDSPRAGAGRTSGSRNHHPTVKPISLCEYLAKLILPAVPGNLLVPFSGSGSEMIGALKSGWSFVTGIEKDPEYAAIAQARIAYHEPRILKASNPEMWGYLY
jgi:site-specific DNA-methyltransferase (adenine-specific)